MAPFVLKFKGNKSFSPLSQISDAESLTRTWKVCTKVASHLEQGQRLENLSWRLWFLQIALVQSDNSKQKREFKKFSKGMSDKLDKDKGRSIHELQAPNFKRTDSTDKVRLRVEEMAHHRENGTVPVSANRYGSADSSNYMKGMQYTFAVDPRVKPLATTPSVQNPNSAEGGRAMMGKMRVRPMHPPPVPAKAQQQAQQTKDTDATMHGASNTTATATVVKNEHAMDVSEDHATSIQQDEGMHDYTHDIAPHDLLDNDEGAGHHTPTPTTTPFHLLPSHHPSSLPYPSSPSSGRHAQALSNALSSATGQFNSSSSQAHRLPNVIRFPTLFSSDFGPTSLLCAIPTSGMAGPSFSFESPSDAYQNFSALGSSTSSITMQGIYGPNGPSGINPFTATQQNGKDVYSPSMVNTGYNNSGIGVGMQNVGTPFNFGVPRPTFEFPIEEILRGEDGSLWDNGGTAMSMDYGMGSTSTSTTSSMGNQWGVPPTEIHSPTTTTGPISPSSGAGNASPTKRNFGLSATAPQRSNSTGVSYGTIISVNGTPKDGTSPNVGTPNGGGGMKTEATEFTGPIRSPRGGATPSTGGVHILPPTAYAGRDRSSSVSGSTTSSGGVGSVIPGNVGNTAPGGVKSECANCGATHTPLWRRGLNDELNCNACGLYCKLHKRARPKNLRTSHGDRAGASWGAKAGEAELAGEPVQCHNCATMATPLWRKDDDGNTLCNACGLYLKLHGTRRPLSMKSDVIRKRSRHETEKRTSVSSIITVMSPSGGPQNSRRNSPTPPPSADSESTGSDQFTGASGGSSGLDNLTFPFGQGDFSFATQEPDYLSSIGMGIGNDLACFTAFGNYFTDHSGSGLNANSLPTPISPTEVQRIVETTVMTGVENGGGHVAPHAKRRRMTLESSVSGSSLAHTTGGANSAHSSPTGLGQKGQGGSPPYFALDATSNSKNAAHTDQNGNASPTRSNFGSSSPNPSYYPVPGVTLDFYGHPIHPPMAPLHPPSLIHPQWADTTSQHYTPTQSSMNQSMQRPPSHSRGRSYSTHSRSNSHHITMPLYLYDGGASSRAYEGTNAATPTASGTATNHPSEEELYNSGFDIFGAEQQQPQQQHQGEDNRVHYGPIHSFEA